jgi:hypothetical protein
MREALPETMMSSNKFCSECRILISVKSVRLDS